MTEGVRDRLDWAKLRPLRLRARAVAEGMLVGSHQSTRRGAGIEHGGHRSYVPGDDLRWLDRKALMRHDKLFVRLFETETERAVLMVVDASASMGYRSPDAPGTKLELASLLAAALARIAIAAGDPVGLACLGGAPALSLPIRGGSQAWAELAETLDAVRADGSLEGERSALEGVVADVARRAPRGSTLVVLSDLLGFPPDATALLLGLTTRRRTLVVVRVLDPAEASFPFTGPVALRSPETSRVVETDATAVRGEYLSALAADTTRWEEALLGRGARLVVVRSDADPVEALGRIVLASAGGRRQGTAA